MKDKSTATMTTTPSSDTRQPLRDIVDIIARTAIPVLLICLFCHPGLTDGLSMAPTLRDHSLLFYSHIGSPGQGDIVVVNSSDLGKGIVKRVIALPGDTIRIEDGVTYLNGEVLDEPYVAYTLDGDYYPETVIPDGECFLMGDNRKNSNDSRGWMGTVPLSEVVGIVRFYF